jgi:hypothetical protein
MSKYHNERTVVEGISFSSKKEARRYGELLWAKTSGDCLWFLRQVPFHLEGGVRYLADFLVFWKGGQITVEDVKGFKTPIYRLKKAQVEARYPVKIVEI